MLPTTRVRFNAWLAGAAVASIGYVYTQVCNSSLTHFHTLLTESHSKIHCSAARHFSRQSANARGRSGGMYDVVGG